MLYERFKVNGFAKKMGVKIKMGTTKRGYFRGDVFWCDELGHMVCIISSWRCLVKSEKIQVCLISSKINKKYDKTHVFLDKDKFGLKKDSMVVCESIHTVSKSSLDEKKVCTLDAITMLSVDERLREQMQLEYKYNRLDAKELENLFLENNSKLNIEKAELEELKNKLYFAQNDFEKAMLLSYQLNEKANKSKLSNKNDYLWYSMYVRSNLKLKIKNYKESLEDVEESIRYISNPTSYSLNYSLSLWLMARNHSEVNEIDKAIRIYNVLIRYYKSVNDLNMRISCMFNLAMLQKSKNNAKRLITIIENAKCSNVNVFNMEDYKQQLIKQMKEEYSTL